MILDCFFYRAFKKNRKQKCSIENAKDRSCWVKVWILHIIILPVSLYAQTEFRVGDVLHTQQVSYKLFGKTEGEDLVWDMSGCEVLQGNCQVKFVANRDSSFHASISRLESGTNYRYELQGDSMLLKGFKNRFVDVKFEEPEVQMHLPLKLHDAVRGLFCGRGEDTMERFVRICGKYETKVSAKGTLVTLDGDSLQNTLLVHSRRWVSSMFSDLQEMLIKYQSLDSVQTLSDKEIIDCLEKDSDVIVLDNYRWFAPGYRYAVFETLSAAQARNIHIPLFQTAFYNAIDDQANLPEDEVNFAIRKLMVTENALLSSLNSMNAANSKVAINDKLSCIFSRTADDLVLDMDYRSDGNDKYSVALYNLSGMQLYRKDLGVEKRGFHNVQLTIRNLSKGVYVLTAFINGKPYSKEVSIN